MNNTGKMSVMGIVILVIILIIGGMFGYVNATREFDKEVHGHVIAAYWSNTPELMIDELNAAVNGTENLGLRPDMYGKWFSWDRTPDNSVDYWLNHFKSVINRTEAVMEWRDGAYKNGTSVESLSDVYEQKMDNLRNFLKVGGWSDETFRKAYYVEYHPLWYWFPAFAAISGITISILIMVILVYGREKEGRGHNSGIIMDTMMKVFGIAMMLIGLMVTMVFLAG